MTDAKLSVQQLIDAYRAGFAALDPAPLIEIWDREHDDLVYVALELAEPMRGWPAIEAYYAALPAVHPIERVIEMRVDDLSIDVLHRDVAVAFCRFHFAGEVAGNADPFVADGRVTFVCRRRTGHWRVVHYHESAPGPLEGSS